MDCAEVQERTGAYLDGELPEDLAVQLRGHAGRCAACSRELEQQRAFIAAVVRADPGDGASAPATLWEAVELKLDRTAPHHDSAVPGVIRLLRKPLAIAASLALLVGAAVFIGILLSGGAHPAHAGTLDFTVLLDELGGSVDAAIERFLSHYEAEPIPAEAAPAAAPALSFAVPSMLPGGFALRQAYRLNFGDAPGVAAVYDRAEEPLLVFFHGIMHHDHSGTYEQSPCIVEDRHGHQVQVGDWRLMHFKGETTCHCVLTRLVPESEILPEILRIIAPDA